LRDSEIINSQIEESEDPLFLKADQDLLNLSNRIQDNNPIYHPTLYRYPLLDYKKFIFIDSIWNGHVFTYENTGLHVLYTRGREKYKAAWDILATVLGKWSILDFMEGPVKKECCATDPYGIECYDAYPASFKRNIVLVDDKNRPFDIISLDFTLILMGAMGKPKMREFSAHIGETRNISLLQSVFDLLNSKICLIPTGSCVNFWEKNFQNKLVDESNKHKKTVNAFLHLVDEEYTGQKLLALYKDLPHLPYGSGLKSLIFAWLDGDLSEDLEFEKWLLGGRSKKVFQLFTREKTTLQKGFEDKLESILQKEFDYKKHRPFPAWSPVRSKTYENRKFFERELGWFINYKKL